MVSFPQVSPPKPLPLPILSTWSAHLLILKSITRTIFDEQYRSLSWSLRHLLHSPVASSVLDPSILLRTLFSNTLSLHSSLNVRDKVLLHVLPSFSLNNTMDLDAVRALETWKTANFHTVPWENHVRSLKFDYLYQHLSIKRFWPNFSASIAQQTEL